MEQLVLYTLPTIRQLTSMVELAKVLLTQNSNLSIIILTPTHPQASPQTAPYISSVSSVFPCISFHFLPTVILQDPSTHTNQSEIFFEILRTSKQHVKEFLQSLSETSPVSAFICYSALDVAQSLNIPTYFYFPSSAAVISLFLNFPEFDKIATDSFRNLGNMSFEVPGLFSIPANQMPEPTLDRGVSYDEFVKMGANFLKCDGIIVNTFESLEPRVMEALKQGTCLPGKIVPPVYCIGPLIADRGEGGENKEERNECLDWLDSQPSKSVMYLSFGSKGVFSKEQVREIAIGLEKSGVRFLWVVRAPPNENMDEPDLDSLLPGGFLVRTKDMGLVVKTWAPQIAVLGHKAIGGLVTHCGWNSTLEAVFAGVPMVAWPLYAEQRFNKIYLIKELKVALPINESENRFVSSCEIEMRVKQIFNSEIGEIVRKRAMNLSHDAKAAIGKGGSSKVALAKLLKSWRHYT